MTLIKAGCRTICYEIHKLIISIWNKEELPDEWKLITVPIYKKGDKTNCSNCTRIITFANYDNILSNLLLSRLTPFAEEIIGGNQGGF